MQNCSTVPHAYQPVSELGCGGMAHVYECWKPAERRMVAVKVSKSELGTAGRDLALREAWLTSRIDHPNVAHVEAYGQLDDRVWMQMELIRGESLREASGRANFTIRQRLEVLRRLACTLSDVHKMGVLHRDIKPGNVILRDDGSVCLIDFGIAKLAGESSKNGPLSGTPTRMPPEWLIEQRYDHRGDIFQLAVLAYDLFAHTLPWEAREHPMQTAWAIVEEAPNALLDVLHPRAAAEFEKIVPAAVVINQMLSARPEDRPQDARALAEALEPVVFDVPIMDPVWLPEAA